MKTLSTKLSRRVAVCGLVGTGALALTAGTGVASATPVHDNCVGVVTVASPASCGLYPGNAKNNTPEQAQVSLDPTGTLLTVLTQNTSDGSAPATTSICLTATPIAQIDHRLQDQQCTKKFGGVWLTWSGGSQTVDLTQPQLSQFLDTTFTVQVGASASAGNGNGDAFYNNVAVNSAPQGTNG
jgi:hypothetical protein